MKVILTQDVESLGLAGQVVKVANGYARNMLLPSELAMEATPSNMKTLEKKRAEYLERAKKEKDRARDLADRIEALHLTIVQKAGEKDKLYGSVTSMDLAAQLAEKGLDIDRRRIKIGDPIKSLGDYDVAVKLHTDVTANLKVTVSRAE
jgi:large subunit ribosomal protein L9